jgi:hypothetical protein
MTHKSLQLRPMSVGDLLDTVFRLYRQHFWLFVGIVAVVQVPFTFIEVLYATILGPGGRVQATVDNLSTSWQWYTTTREFEADVMLIQFLLMGVGVFVFYGLTNGAMARAIHNRYLDRPLSLGDAYGALGWRWLRMLGAFVVLGVLDLACFLLFLIPCLGWVAAPVLLIFFNVPLLSFLAPVIVVEDHGVSAAFRRAMALGRGKFWRVLGINFLLGLLTSAISSGLPTLVGVLFVFWGPGFLIETLITSFLGLFLALLVRPIWACGLILLYFDLRVRLEGFDLQLMAERMGGEISQAGVQMTGGVLDG